MKAITLTQPWATLVAINAKKIETRSWPTLYRGPLAIHAAKNLDPVGGLAGLASIVSAQPFRDALAAWEPNAIVRPDYYLPRGCVVAVCELGDCVATSDTRTGEWWEWQYADWVSELSAQERAFGDYTPGRYGWTLWHIARLSTPEPARGKQGLWDWTPKRELIYR